MTFFTSFHCSVRYCLATLFLISSLSGVLAQPTIVVTTLPNSLYKISTTDLDANDLVFYRYSDGYDLSAMSTAVNPEASVTRKFKSAQVKVSAFVARKNGPIELTTGDIANASCANCPVPSAGLLPGEFIRVRPTSWSPFIEPEFPASLADIKTTPVCNTPGTPWFILPITIKAPSASTYLDLTIPSGMTIKGAVVKSIWKQLAISLVPFFITDADVQSFTYSSAGSLRINMTAAFGAEFNVYLIVESDTELGEESAFSAQLFNSGGSPLGAQSSTKTITHQNPHDPNTLSAFEPSTCGLRTDNTPLGYRVDFQNLGAGDAETVIVMVMIDPSVLDHLSLANIHSSHNITFHQTSANLVAFEFANINLTGLNRDPQPALEETKGWVEFSLETYDCLPLGFFRTIASVTFIGNGGNFNETIGTNQTKQYIANCGPDPFCMSFLRNQEEGEDIAPATSFITGCYPTVFEDVLHVNVLTFEDGGNMSLTLSDLTGRIYLKKSYQTSPNTEMREDLNTAGLPGGVYLVQVRQGTKTAVFKVIKE